MPFFAGYLLLLSLEIKSEAHLGFWGCKATSEGEEGYAFVEMFMLNFIRNCIRKSSVCSFAYSTFFQCLFVFS